MAETNIESAVPVPDAPISKVLNGHSMDPSIVKEKCLNGESESSDIQLNGVASEDESASDKSDSKIVKDCDVKLDNNSLKDKEDNTDRDCKISENGTIEEDLSDVGKLKSTEIVSDSADSPKPSLNDETVKCDKLLDKDESESESVKSIDEVSEDKSDCKKSEEVEAKVSEDKSDCKKSEEVETKVSEDKSDCKKSEEVETKVDEERDAKETKDSCSEMDVELKLSSNDTEKMDCEESKPTKEVDGKDVEEKESETIKEEKKDGKDKVESPDIAIDKPVESEKKETPTKVETAPPPRRLTRSATKPKPPPTKSKSIYDESIDDDDEIKICEVKKKTKDEGSDIEMIEESDPLAISEADVQKAKHTSKKESSIILVEHITPQAKRPQNIAHQRLNTGSLPNSPIPTVQSAIQQITGGTPAIQGLQAAYLSAVQQVLVAQGAGQVSNPQYLSQLQQYYNTLGALQDDAYVIEAPSFIVPYVMEGKPVESIKDYVTRVTKEDEDLKKSSEDEAKKDEDKDKSESEKKEESVKDDVEKEDEEKKDDSSKKIDDSKDESKKDVEVEKEKDKEEKMEVDEKEVSEKCEKKDEEEDKEKTELDDVATKEKDKDKMEDSKEKGEDSKEKDEDSKEKDEDSEEKDENSKVQDEDSKVKDEDSKVQDEDSKVKDEDSKVKDEDSKVKDEDFKVKDEDFKVKDEDSKEKDEDSKEKDEDSKEKDEDSKEKDKDSKEKDEDAKGKSDEDKENREDEKEIKEIEDVDDDDDKTLEQKLKEKKKSEEKENLDKDKDEEKKEDLSHLGRWETYYKSSLGKFFLDLGLNQAKAFIQADLLKMQKKKVDKMKTQPSRQELLIVKSLETQLALSRKKNAHLAIPLKCCKFCTYKTESQMVMERHLESPHMTNYTYRCNFCSFETRGPQVILFHTEAEHNVRGRLERAPAFFQCPMCPWEDNNKAKMTRHSVSCAKKFKPEKNCELMDWEPPAKIPKVNRGRSTLGKTFEGLKMPILPKSLGALNLNLTALSNSLIASNQANNLAGRGRGRPVGSYKGLPGQMGGRGNTGLMFQSRSPSQGLQNVSPNLGAQAMGNRVPRILPASGNTNIISGLSPSSSITIQSVGSKSGNTKSPQQPSISITPLPRGGGQGSSLKPGMPNGRDSANGRPSFVICEICDGYIKDLEQLRNHMNWIHKVKIHPKMIYNRPPLNCQKCQHRFFTDQGLERHLLGTHGLVTSSMQEAANKGKDAGRCPICGKVFQWKLLNHVSRDHKMTLKPAHLSYKCTVCTATFNMYRLFENHVYSAHSVVNKNKAAGDTATGSGSSSGSTNQAKKSIDPPLKINDEITIIPQPSTKTKEGEGKSRNESPSISKEITITKVGTTQSLKRSGVEVISLDDSPSKKEPLEPPKKRARETATSRRARTST